MTRLVGRTLGPTLRLACSMACAVSVATAPVTAASDDLTVAEKARVFGVDLAERFIQDGQVRVRRRLPSTDHPEVTFNMSDTAYMTGIHCATATWRYLATADPAAAAQARAAASALGHLARASTPRDAPWFDDGVWRENADGRYRWRGDVSSDQVDALMFGLFVYGRHVADAAERRAVGRTVGAVVDAVVDNGYRLIRYDGQPARWGHYELDYVTTEEPMNALLLLQMVKVAHALTDDPRYDREYRRLVDLGYARIGEGARLDEPPLDANHSDDVLIALALYPLLELEHDAAIRAHYLEAARRWFRGGVYPSIDVEANPLATYLYQHWTGDDERRQAALDTLRHVPLDMKWNPGTIAAYAERFRFAFTADAVEPSGGCRTAAGRPAWAYLELSRPQPVSGRR